MWGVIPAAGLGSRVESYHVDGCKELIEIAGRSMLARTVDELVEAGIEGIVVVTSPHKPAIKRHLEEIYPNLETPIEFVEQTEADGLVPALELAREVVGDDMLVALPDNLFISDESPTGVLLETLSNFWVTVVAAVPVHSPWGDWLSDVGRLAPSDRETMEHGWAPSRIMPKDKDRSFPITEPPSWRVTGRYLLTRDFWNLTGTDADRLDILCRRTRMLAMPIDAEYLDVGVKQGLLMAEDRLAKYD